MFAAIHASDPDPKLLAYQYLQTLPQIAQGDANKLWIVPSEFSKALEGLAGLTGAGAATARPAPSWLDRGGEVVRRPADRAEETLDTGDWFDSKLPPARLQPEAEIRASDRDAESAAAHAGLSYDPPDGAGRPARRRRAAGAAADPAAVSGPPSEQQQHAAPPSGQQR